MKRPSVSIRGFMLALLMIPYLLVVLGAISSYFTFYHRTSFQSMIASSPREEIATVILSVAEFEKIKWTEEGKEFEYEGKMYDVAKVEKQGSNYVIACENDSLEDLFINWMKSVSKSKSKSISQIQFSEPIVQFEVENIKVPRKKNVIPFENHYSAFLSEIIPPPPRIL